jgi:hypothetical protein
VRKPRPIAGAFVFVPPLRIVMAADFCACDCGGAGIVVKHGHKTPSPRVVSKRRRLSHIR